MDHNNEYNPNEFMMQENFAFTPMPFHSPNLGVFASINLPAIDDKLNLEYSSLLNPESKDSVISKIDQYNEAGRVFINANQYHNALRIYEYIIQAQPKNEKAAVLLGKCLQINDEHQRAIFFLRYAMEISDKIKIENYTQAEQNFRHSLKIDSCFAQKYTIYLYLGLINKYNLQHKIAIEYFLMNLQEPQNQNAEKASLVLINIGQCLESLQEYDEAASCYNKSLCLTPGNFIALKAISWLFFQNGKISESKDILQQALFISHDREIYYMQARCLEQLGKYKEAIQAISQAIQQAPNCSENYTLLGVIFNKLNMNLESFQSFQRAYQLDISKIENLFNMALIYEVAKKYTDALKLYSKLLLLDPQDCIVLQRKACIESSNFQNLTEYQFQMRYPAFKPSAQLWWIENQKQQKYNVLHDTSDVSLFQNNSEQINEKIEYVEGQNSIFENKIQKNSLLTQDKIKKHQNNEENKSQNLNKSSQKKNNHKDSISANFNNAFLSQKQQQFNFNSLSQQFLFIGNSQFIRSRNSSFNIKTDENANDIMNGQFGINTTKQNIINSNKLSQDLYTVYSQGTNRKDSSIDITALQKRAQLSQLHRNKLFSTDQAIEGGNHNQIHEKKEENDNYYSNSPKKEDKQRKESDLFYEQTRRNSMLSNFGGQFHHFQYGYSPFHGAISKDSMDFGYNISNNLYGDQLDVHGNVNSNDFINKQKKSSIIGNNIYSQYNKNVNKNDNQIFQ